MVNEKHKTTLIYACNGVSAFGRLTNDAADVLEKMGIGHKACLAGVGAGIEFKINDSKKATERIVLDGCKLCCVKKILENAGINDNISVVVPDSGIKIRGGKPSPEDTNRLCEYAIQKIEEGIVAK